MASERKPQLMLLICPLPSLVCMVQPGVCTFAGCIHPHAHNLCRGGGSTLASVRQNIVEVLYTLWKMDRLERWNGIWNGICNGLWNWHFYSNSKLYSYFLINL